MKSLYRLELICLLVLLFEGGSTTAQTTRKVLFLGNSYTAVNNLPQIVYDIAASAGDTLIFDSHTPGGYTLQDHSQDPTSTAKIMAGGWDYVVLQGQSQEPITHAEQFTLGAEDLHDLIRIHSPCAIALFYMTWGRKNGDASNCANFPVMCTYEGMDTTLRNQYLALTDYLNSEVSPVSVVWHYLRQNNPGIELYQPDESHPSKAGSYAAACCFYATIFKKDPALISYNYGLPSSDAAAIRNAAKTAVYAHLNDWDFKQLPVSQFQYHVGPGVNQVVFHPLNYGAIQSYHWDFGDGDTSTLPNVNHSYAANGTYTVTLTTTNCDLQGLHYSSTDTVIQFCSHTPTVTTAHPWLCSHDTLWTQPADAYQWYSVGMPIPETQQFLPDYQKYIYTNFSVRTTVNGCSELSQEYYAAAEWPGYYFDAAWGGDPCLGDTALFIALHINDSLPDSTIIRWYRNDTLIPGTNDQDTLLITTEGSYTGKVIDPHSHCPLDTTFSFPVVFDCTSQGIWTAPREVSWNIYPNPASDQITIELPSSMENGELRIYDATGRIIRSAAASQVTSIDVRTLAAGLYYIRFENSAKPAQKFIKL